MRQRVTTIVTHPLATLALEIAVVCLVLRMMASYVGHGFDLALTTAMTIAYGWTLWLQGKFTRVWTHRGLGFFGTIGGDMLLYFALGIGALTGYQSGLLIVTRACLIVGVTHLSIGLWQMRQRRRTEAGDEQA